MTKIIFCTTNLPLARFIHWFTDGYAHCALILANGNWLDARGTDGGGLKERPPETDLFEYEVVDLPFDIEPFMRSMVTTPYNFRSVFAQLFHFKWSSPKSKYCDQAILSACRLAGYQIIDEGREGRITPQGCCDVLKAYLKGTHDGKARRSTNDS